MIPLTARVELLTPEYDESMIAGYHSRGYVWANLCSVKTTALSPILQRRGDDLPVRPLLKITFRKEIEVGAEFRVVFKRAQYAFVSEALNPDSLFQSFLINRIDEGEA